MLNISDLLIFDLSTVDICSYKNKHITRSKDSPITTTSPAIKKQNDSNLLISVTLTESVCSCKSKHANTKNHDNK